MLDGRRESTRTHALPRNRGRTRYATGIQRGTREELLGSAYDAHRFALRQDGGWRTASWGLAAQAVKLFEGRLLLLSKASAPKWNCPNYSQARAAASSPLAKKEQRGKPGGSPRLRATSTTHRGRSMRDLLRPQRGPDRAVVLSSHFYLASARTCAYTAPAFSKQESWVNASSSSGSWTPACAGALLAR